MTPTSNKPYEITARKQAYLIPISKELLRDVDPTYGMTAEELADYEARQQAWLLRHEELRAAGLLDDDGDEIRITDCSACTTVGNYDSTDRVRCERERGHEGAHKFTFDWEVT